MHKLFPYFEQEMSNLRHNVQDFSLRYPSTAATMGISGGQGTDPTTERVMQGTALLAAQISRKIDYYHTRWTNDLLGILGPFYLRPIPSCSVVQVEPNEKRAIATIPRGTELATRAAPACRFRTVYDVDIPLITLAAAYTTRIDAPLSLDLPPDVGGEITITIQSKDSTVLLDKAVISAVRVCIDTDPRTRAALYDALLARALCVCVESEGQWHKLAAVPFAPVGFAASEALLPTPRRQDDSLRLLAEYLAFPEKFEFFDIDLKPVLAQCLSGARRVVLHVIMPDLHQTSTPHLLRALPATALRLGCTPVVNMFTRMAEPIRVMKGCTTYPLTLSCTKDAEGTVYSIDAMKLLGNRNEGRTAIDMAWSLGQTRVRENHYWLFKLADITAGTKTTVSFVDERRRALDSCEGTVETQLTCTNGDQPAALPFGRAGGDLVGDKVAAGYPIRLLRTPTAPFELADKPDSHFDVIAAISAANRAPLQFHLPALLDLLRLHARPDCGITERQLAGIVALERRRVTGWLAHDYGASLVYGYEIHLTIDEAAFAERSVYAFAQVMDCLLGYYMWMGNFTRLIVQAADGRELVRCAQRPGCQSPA
jgi:type VI secretion system protein ImpG